MAVIHLRTLAPWPDTPHGPAADRWNLLVAAANTLGVISRHGLAPDAWNLVTVTTSDLPDLRAAVETEGTKTDRHLINVGAGRQWRTHARHPARARHQLLATIDRHTPEPT